MPASTATVYTPPPTLKAFMQHHRAGELFYSWVVGPVGSGKTTANFMKLAYLASRQAPGPDGIRRSRAVIVRNTAPQLQDTTIKSWMTWFRDGEAGSWHVTDKRFVLRFGDVECEVLFRPLDTPQDVARVLSLEVTFAILDEFVEIPRAIVDALSARCGRYPAQKDGGATHFGMWGASNPSTEDNWWFEYLHVELPDNAQFFSQPSGFSDAAENLDNLPGGRQYYTAQAKGKTVAWIKQFIEAEWGFSASGKPVIPSFRGDLHTATGLRFNPLQPLIMGMDPGIGGMAGIFGQEDHRGRLLVFGEVIESGIGAERFLSEVVKPYIRRRFPNAQVVVAPDPAAANRAQTDERSVVDVIRKHYPVKIETNNRLPKRIDAIEHYTTKLTSEGVALLIDAEQAPVLVRALKGGWRFTINQKRDAITTPEPEKNAYSHPADAFGYLARYFHRDAERSGRTLGSTKRPFTPPRPIPQTYHIR
jgi:hypothetical protein